MSSDFKVANAAGTRASKMMDRIEAGSTGHTAAWSFWWRQTIDFSARPGFVGEVALVSNVQQIIDLENAFPNNQFPHQSNGFEGALKETPVFRVDQHAAGSGVTQVDMAMGDNVSDVVLIQFVRIDIGTIGWRSTPAASEYAPDIRRDTGGLVVSLGTPGATVDQIETGIFQLAIHFTPIPSDQHYTTE